MVDVPTKSKLKNAGAEGLKGGVVGGVSKAFTRAILGDGIGDAVGGVIGGSMLSGNTGDTVAILGVDRSIEKLTSGAKGSATNQDVM